LLWRHTESLKIYRKAVPYYEDGIKPVLTKGGQKWFHDTANFLKHADRDPDAVLHPNNLPDNESRIGFCIILYRDLKEKFTPPMAAFHNWMVIRHPDEFMIAEDGSRSQPQLIAKYQRTCSQRDACEAHLADLMRAYPEGPS
jgi:hypothetical protein